MDGSLTSLLIRPGAAPIIPAGRLNDVRHKGSPVREGYNFPEPRWHGRACEALHGQAPDNWDLEEDRTSCAENGIKLYTKLGTQRLTATIYSSVTATIQRT